MTATRIRVALPTHLRMLAGVDREVQIELPPRAGHSPTIDDLLDALEAEYPMLRGTIREHGTLKRRAYMRFFACGRDISHDPQDSALPDPVLSGTEPFIVIGAISGGLPA